MSKKWVITGKRFFSRAFEVAVVADSAHDAGVVADKKVKSSSGMDEETQQALGVTYFDERIQYDDIIVVKEVKS